MIPHLRKNAPHARSCNASIAAIREQLLPTSFHADLSSLAGENSPEGGRGRGGVIHLRRCRGA